MNTIWREAPAGRRPAFYCDVGEHRLFVQQSVRSHCARGLVGHEYQLSHNGVRQGEFTSLRAAQLAGELMAQTKTAPRV